MVFLMLGLSLADRDRSPKNGQAEEGSHLACESRKVPLVSTTGKEVRLASGPLLASLKESRGCGSLTRLSSSLLRPASVTGVYVFPIPSVRKQYLTTRYC